jgi:hypothetical protein
MRRLTTDGFATRWPEKQGMRGSTVGFHGCGSGFGGSRLLEYFQAGVAEATQPLFFIECACWWLRPRSEFVGKGN